MLPILYKDRPVRTIQDVKQVGSDGDIVYYPFAFQRYRDQAGADDYETELSSVRGGGKGAGKSDMAFWTSKTDKYIIKTMTEGELKFLIGKIPEYLEYQTKNPGTFLPKIFGVYREAGTPFFVQNNVKGRVSVKGGKFYDLKGSHRHRTTDYISAGSGTGKDNDWGKSKILLKDAKAIHAQLAKDTALLQKWKVMDYSLLLFLQPDTTRCPMEIVQFQGPAPSKPEQACVRFGVIDVLQRYTLMKRIESLFKTKTRNRSASEVSAINPVAYRDRFLNMIAGVIQDSKK